MILKLDKGNSTLIMDIEVYHKKMIEHLITSGSYRKISDDTDNKIIKDIMKALHNSSLDDSIKKKISPKNPIFPRIYVLPKLQKDGFPLRSIVNIIVSPSYVLVKVLTKIFKGRVGKTDSFIDDSSHFIRLMGRRNIKAI